MHLRASVCVCVLARASAFCSNIYRCRFVNIEETIKERIFVFSVSPSHKCLHFASVVNKGLLTRSNIPRWLFHSSTVDAKTSSLVATPRNPSTTLAILICQDVSISSLSLSLFYSCSFLPSLILCSIVSRTPSRITKMNSSLVVSCNLRKTRAIVSEHGPTSL